MPLTLPLDRTAVLVVECQNDLVHESRIGAAGIGGALAAAVQQRNVLEHIAAVLTAARAAAVPVLYVNKETDAAIPSGSAPLFRFGQRPPILRAGSSGAEIHPAIAPQPQDIVIRRFVGVDASYDANLFGALRALGRSLLVLMGVSTNFAVEGTVRGAVNQGFGIVVVEDACASVPDEMHRFSTERILPLLGTVCASAEVVAALRTAAFSGSTA